MDLSTEYLGMKLKHPIIASASPLTSTLDGIRMLEDAGAAAVIMASLFEEQVRAEDTAYAMYTDHGSYSQPETGSYFPELPEYDRGVSGHIDTLRRAVEAVEIPVIASLNAATTEGWVDYSARLEQAGAAALELNVHFVPADASLSNQDVEAHYVEVVRAVKRTVRIPVSLKLSPYFSSMGHTAHDLAGAGADGLVLFNRFYQPDIDLATMSVKSELHLSTSYETGLPMLWIALLAGRLSCSLAATSGVEGAEQVIKYLLVGADTVMTASALLRHGPSFIQSMATRLAAWLEEHGYPSVAAIRGLKSVNQLDDASELLRVQYMRLLTEYVPGNFAA